MRLKVSDTLAHNKQLNTKQYFKVHQLKLPGEVIMLSTLPFNVEHRNPDTLLLEGEITDGSGWTL